MMMLLTVFVSLWATPVLAQDSVDQAYQREYAYLAAEKRALMARLSALDGESSRAQGSVETDIARLEIALKRAEGARSDSQDALEARERAAAGDDESRMILDATISQAAESIDAGTDGLRVESVDGSRAFGQMPPPGVLPPPHAAAVAAAGDG